MGMTFARERFKRGKAIFFFSIFFFISPFRFSKGGGIDYIGWNSISFGPWGLRAFFARANPKGNGSWSVLLKETVLPEFMFYSRIFIRLFSK